MKIIRITGLAGTGKSTVLQAAKRYFGRNQKAWNNQKVWDLSGMNSTTVAGLLQRTKTVNATFVCDEPLDSVLRVLEGAVDHPGFLILAMETGRGEANV